jgi:hypothetical protein
MHPTANSAAFIRESWMPVQLNARRVMPGVMLLLLMHLAIFEAVLSLE